jgi:hypothetical protein
MKNRMMDFKRNMITQNFQPKTIISCAWCNLCEDHHDENNYEVKRSAKECIFGKKTLQTIATLDWVEEE